MLVLENLKKIQQEITDAAMAAGRLVADITLVAVSKMQSVALIEEAIAVGQRDFGENRVQEAQEKWQALKQKYPDVRLHLIGALQTNKVKEALALFDVIHTLDRLNLAKKLAQTLPRGQKTPEFLVQVNTGHEPQKSGVLPQEADAFIQQCRQEYGLAVKGLMCIPPVEEDPALHFALLQKLAKEQDLPWLSMGMSADFACAIQFGATHIRVGTALFGERT